LTEAQKRDALRELGCTVEREAQASRPGQPVLDYRPVPRRYGAEWRCQDEAACHEHQGPRAVAQAGS
jgi:hypothetical protein